MDPESDRLISTDGQEREAQLYLRHLEFIRALGIPVKNLEDMIAEQQAKLQASLEVGDG